MTSLLTCARLIALALTRVYSRSDSTTILRVEQPVLATTADRHARWQVVQGLPRRRAWIQQYSLYLVVVEPVTEHLFRAPTSRDLSANKFDLLQSVIEVI